MQRSYYQQLTRQPLGPGGDRRAAVRPARPGCTWYFGNLGAESQLNMVSPTTPERRLDVVVDFEYLDGVPEAERPVNKGNFLVKFLNLVVFPADVNGTANVTWRYRDPGKRDS